MLKTLQLLLLSVLFSASSHEVLENGFYLTVDCAVRGEIRRKSTLDDQKTVCLSRQPVVSIHEIEAVSEMIEVGIMSSFDVFISAKALNQFNILRASLKSTSIALVIDNKVLFLVTPETHLEHILRVTVFGDPRIRDVREKIVAQLAKAKN